MSDTPQWVPVKERTPIHGDICFISDGTDVGLACWVDGRGSMPGRWAAQGFGGFEWEWDFEPTHWLPLTLSLPKR